MDFLFIFYKAVYIFLLLPCRFGSLRFIEFHEIGHYCHAFVALLLLCHIISALFAGFIELFRVTDQLVVLIEIVVLDVLEIHRNLPAV